MEIQKRPRKERILRRQNFFVAVLVLRRFQIANGADNMRGHLHITSTLRVWAMGVKKYLNFAHFSIYNLDKGVEGLKIKEMIRRSYANGIAPQRTWVCTYITSSRGGEREVLTSWNLYVLKLQWRVKGLLLSYSDTCGRNGFRLVPVCIFDMSIYIHSFSDLADIWILDITEIHQS